MQTPQEELQEGRDVAPEQIEEERAADHWRAPLPGDCSGAAEAQVAPPADRALPSAPARSTQACEKRSDLFMRQSVEEQNDRGERNGEVQDRPERVGSRNVDQEEA